MIVCRHIPPAPGCHDEPESCVRSPDEFAPALTTVGRMEERGVLDAGQHVVGIGQRRLEVPHPGELPGVGRTVVPLVRARARHRS